MKKLFKTLLSVVLFSLFIVNIDAATLKEDSSKYTSDVYIIGTTKFDGSKVITKAMLEEAAENDLALQELLAEYNGTTFNAANMDLSVYYFNKLDEKWAEISEDVVSVEIDTTTGKASATINTAATFTNEQLTSSKVEEVKSKNIYYEDNEVKKLTYTYTTSANESISEDDIDSVNTVGASGVKYDSKTNTFTVDATVLAFTFTVTTTTTETITDDDGNEVEVVTTTSNTFGLENTVSITEKEVTEEPIVIKGPELEIEDLESYSVNSGEEVTFIVKETLNDYEKAEDLTREFYFEEKSITKGTNGYTLVFNEDGEYTVTYLIKEKDTVIAEISKTFEISLKPEVTITLAEEYANSSNNTFTVKIDKANSYAKAVTEELTVVKGNAVAAITLAGIPYVSGSKVTLSDNLIRNFNLGFNESGTYTLTYILKDEDVEIYKEVKTITVKKLPTAVINAEESYTIDNGAKVTVSVTPELNGYTNATGALTVTGATVSGTDEAYDITFTTPGTYTLTYTISEGTKTLGTITKNISVIIKPEVSISLEENKIDASKSTILNVSLNAHGYEGSVKEVLVINGSESEKASGILTETSKAYTLSSLSAGTYTISYKLLDSNDALLDESDEVTLTVLTTPTVFVSTTSDSYLVNKTDDIVVTVAENIDDYATKDLTKIFTVNGVTKSLTDGIFTLNPDTYGEFVFVYSITNDLFGEVTSSKTINVELKPEVTVTTERYNNDNTNAYTVSIADLGSYANVVEKITVSGPEGSSTSINLGNATYSSGSGVGVNLTIGERNFNLGFNKPGAYEIVYTLTYGTTTLFTDTKDVTVYELPEISLTTESDSYLLNANNSVVVTINQDLNDYEEETLTKTFTVTKNDAIVIENNITTETSYTLSDLTAGEYTATYVITYAGEEIASASKTFNVNIKPTVTASAADTYSVLSDENVFTSDVTNLGSYEDIIETLTVTDNTNSATITLGENAYTTGQTLTEVGTREFNLDFLKAGTYTLTYALTSGTTELYSYDKEVTVTNTVNSISELQYALSKEGLTSATLGSNLTVNTATTRFVVNKSFTLDLGGKTIDLSNNTAFNVVSGGALTLDNGVINFTYAGSGASQPISVNTGSLTVNDRVTINTDQYGIFVLNNGSVVFDGTLNITGDNDDAAGIAGNGLYSGDQGTTITINSNAVINGTGSHTAALFLPQNGVTTINGGTLTSVTGIYIKSGTLNINDGTITGTGAKVLDSSLTFNNNGFNDNGDAIFIEENTAYEDHVVITVSDNATLVSTNNNKIREYNPTGTLTSTVNGTYTYKVNGSNNASHYIEDSASVDYISTIGAKTTAFVNKYYNKFTNEYYISDMKSDGHYTYHTADFDKNIIYLEIGEVNSDITGIVLNKTDYENIYHWMSIGMNAFLKIRPYIIEDNTLYVALPYLIVEALPGTNNTIVTSDGRTFTVTLYSSEVGTLSIGGIVASTPANSGVNTVVYSYDSTNGKYIVNETSSNKSNSLGVVLKDGETLLNTADTVVFRLSSNLSLGMTKPANLSGELCTESSNDAVSSYPVNYQLYLSSSAVADFEASELGTKPTQTFKLAVPGYGTLKADFTLNAIALD